MQCPHFPAVVRGSLRYHTISGVATGLASLISHHGLTDRTQTDYRTQTQTGRSFTSIRLRMWELSVSYTQGQGWTVTKETGRRITTKTNI